MPSPQDLTPLEERKRMIVLQADLHRSLLQAELVGLRSQFDRLGEARDKVRAAGPWLGVVAAVAGVFAARNWRSLAGWAPTAIAAWRWIQEFRRM